MSSMQIMTVQEAIEILKANWWKDYNPSLKHEEYDLIIGDTKETGPDDKYFPNCYLINTAIVKKGKKLRSKTQSEEKGWGEMFVSKIDGKCGNAIMIG